MRLAALASMTALFAGSTLGGCGDSTSPKGDAPPADPANVQGTWTGTWDSSVHGIHGSFRVDLLQNGGALTGTIDIPTLGMSGTELSGTVTGKRMTFGDIGQRIVFIGTVAADTLSASGTYTYPEAGDKGTWAATRGGGSFITLADSLAVPAFLSGDLTFGGGRFHLLGAGEMIYTVDPSAGVVDSLVTPGPYPGGIAFDGQHLLVGDGPMGMSKIFRVDPASPSVLPSPGTWGITGLAYDGASLWCVNDHYATPRIYRIDADGTVLDSLSCSGTAAHGLAWDGTHLWYTAFAAGKTIIYRSDLSGAVETSFEAPTFLAAGLAFDGTHLWCAGRFDDTIYQLDTAGHVLSSFDAPGESPADLVCDGTHLWQANGDLTPGPDRIYELDMQGNALSSLECPGSSPGGLAFDGTHLWQADTQTRRIYRLEVSGNNYWAYPPAEVRYLTHDGSRLWSCDETAGTIYRFDSSGNIVASFASPGSDVGGLTWDGASLWVAGGDFIHLNTLWRLSPAGQLLATYEPFASLPAPYGLAFDGSDLWYIGQVPFESSFKLYRLRLE